MMVKFENALREQLGVIDNSQLKIIINAFDVKKIKKDEFLLKVDSPCNELFFINYGLLRIFVQADKKEITQWISTPGYFVADLSSFIFDGPARWNFQALTDLEVFSISKSKYQNLAHSFEQWNILEKRFLMHCFTNLENRIFTHLSMTAEERYQFFFNQNKELFNLVPLQYIASMLGMTPETFSRIRKKQNS